MGLLDAPGITKGAVTSLVGRYVTMPAPSGGDDTAAIVAARDAAGVNGRLVFAEGTYITTGVLANKAGQKWELWPGATLKAAAASTASVIEVRANDVEIHGYGGSAIDGNRANVTTGTGTAIYTGTGVDGLKVTGKLRVQNTHGYGIWIRDATRTSVEGVYVTGTALTSIIFDHSTRDGFSNSIIGCTVDRTAEATSITSAGIQFRGGGGKKNDHGKVCNNSVRMPRDVTDPLNWAICIEVAAAANHTTINGNDTYQGQMGISVANTTGCTVAGNTVNAPSSGTAGVNQNYGIELANAPFSAVTGNSIDGQDIAGQPVTWEGVGFSQAGSTSCTISGNAIRQTSNDGINVGGGSDRPSIVGNNIETSRGRGITVANATDPTIAGNVILGSGGGVTDAIRLWSLSIAVNGATITGNRATGFPNGINIQGAAALVTDYLTAFGNNFQGCTNPTTATLTAGATIGSNCKVLGTGGSVGALDTLPGQRFVTTRYYGPQFGSAGSSATTAGQLHATPFIVNRWPSQSFDRIAIDVSGAAAGSTVRLGIYSDDATGSPGTLLLDAGTIDSSTVGAKELTITQTLPPGRYWLAAVAQGGTPTVGTVTGMSPYVGRPAGAAGHTTAYHVTGVTGALPATFGTPADSNFALRVALRAA